MKTGIPYILSFIILFIAAYSNSQTIRDTIALDEVNVFESIDIAPIGGKSIQIDSIFIASNNTSNLSDIIMLHSPIYIKSYGNGGLASASFRGTTASQTQVLWNGISLNSPMLGQIDFSLIPVFFVDDIHINYGPGSLQETSGGLGGSINLINKPNWNNHINIQAVQSLGSFNSHNSLFKINYGNLKIQNSIKLFYSVSENNFEFYNDLKDTVLTRKFAGYNSKGLLHETYLRIDQKNTISVRFWYQLNYRNLPANITVEEDSLIATQEDNTFKAIIEWNNYTDKGKIRAYTAFIRDELIYTNKDLDEKSLNISNVFKNHFQYSYEIAKNHHLNTNINYQYFAINTKNYEKNKEAGILNTSVIINGKLRKALSYSFTLRYENFDFNKSSGIMPFIGLEYQSKKIRSLSFYFNLAKNNRFPTMNDLYWNNYGNPELEPEVSKSIEFGLNHQKSIANLKFENYLTIYNSVINNWISWQPDANSIFDWKPVNYKKVHSRGIEVKSMINYKFKNTIIKFNTFYNLALTSNSKIYGNEDINSLNKQLIYIPVNSVNSDIEIVYDKYSISCAYSFIDKRYTLSNNMEYMPAYAFLDMVLSRRFEFTDLNFVFEFRIKNLTDISYQSIAYYPMPGRNYIGKVIFNFTEDISTKTN